MKKIAFATISVPAKLERACLLFESLRTFGGVFSDAPAFILARKGQSDFQPAILDTLTRLHISVIPYDLPAEAARFPLASLVYAAAEGEKNTVGEFEILVWMNDDTLIFHPPTPFLIPRGISYAYRPVHHTRIGSEYNKPLDGFWSLLYKHCRVAEKMIFPMETCSRDAILRPHFNAGLIVTRPERRLLNTWRERFDSLYRHPDFEPFFRDNNLYRIFMHQAVLAGVVIGMFNRKEILELPENINYPLHLHSSYPPEYRPVRLNDLTTCRYEEFSNLRDSLQTITIEEPVRTWLEKHLNLMPG